MSNNIVQFNEDIIRGQIKELVRGSVDEALIEMYLGRSVRVPCGGHEYEAPGDHGTGAAGWISNSSQMVEGKTSG